MKIPVGKSLRDGEVSSSGLLGMICSDVFTTKKSLFFTVAGYLEYANPYLIVMVSLRDFNNQLAPPVLQVPVSTADVELALAKDSDGKTVGKVKLSDLLPVILTENTPVKGMYLLFTLTISHPVHYSCGRAVLSPLQTVSAGHPATAGTH